MALSFKKPKGKQIILTRAQAVLLRKIKKEGKVTYLDPIYYNIHKFRLYKPKIMGQFMSKKDFLRRNSGGTHETAIKLFNLGFLQYVEQENEGAQGFILNEKSRTLFSNRETIYVRLQEKVYQPIVL